jgi:replication factor C large subunit
MSLFAKGKVILVDEVDGLSGTKDRGGIPAIVDIIKKTSFPLILTGINPFDKKFSKLRNVATLVEFSPLSHKDVAMVLERICNTEKADFEPLALTSIGRRCAGDMRAAINDLQSVHSSAGSVTRAAVDDLGERNQTDTIVEALTKILKSTDPNMTIRALDTVDEDYNEVLLWLDENMPKEYEKPEDLARAYDMLSRADIFNSRIRRWQHWRFLVYVNAMLSAGVAVSKDERYSKPVDYKPTGRILKLWWAKQKSMKKKAIAGKLAAYSHTSTKQALQSIDYLKTIFRKDAAMSESIAEQLELDKDEVAWLKK